MREKGMDDRGYEVAINTVITFMPRESVELSIFVYGRACPIGVVQEVN